MQKVQAVQFQAAMDGFISSLPKGYTETAWPDDPNIAFVLQEKAPRGTWEDGKRYREVGRITYDQARIIATTSQGPQEMGNRIRMLVLEGTDTTRYRAPAYTTESNMISMEKVQEIVKLALIEAEKVRAGTMPAASPDAIVERVIAPPAPVGQKAGVQAKKRKNVKTMKADKAKTIEIWTKRAEILQIDKPVLRPRDGHIDGRWLRTANRLWEAHLTATPATSETVSEPVA